MADSVDEDDPTTIHDSIPEDKKGLGAEDLFGKIIPCAAERSEA